MLSPNEDRDESGEQRVHKQVKRQECESKVVETEEKPTEKEKVATAVVTLLILQSSGLLTFLNRMPINLKSYCN